MLKYINITTTSRTPINIDKNIISKIFNIITILTLHQLPIYDAFGSEVCYASSQAYIQTAINYLVKTAYIKEFWILICQGRCIYARLLGCLLLLHNIIAILLKTLEYIDSHNGKACREQEEKEATKWEGHSTY